MGLTMKFRNSCSMLVLGLLFLVSMLHGSCINEDSRQDPSGSNTDYDAALKFLLENNEMALTVRNKAAIASWDYNSNLTETNKKKMLDSLTEEGKFEKKTWANATSFAWKDFKERNETVYRWFKQLSTLGISALPEDKLTSFNSIVADMQDVYSKAKVCKKDTTTNCSLTLEPDLTEILKTSRDYDELKRIWAAWRDVSGKKVKEDFNQYVKLTNEAAKLNGFKDGGEMWRNGYESETFVEDVEELWNVIKPLYKQLHAYVRSKLLQHYSDHMTPDGPIPAHLLGNMWSQSWGNIFDLVKPFPQKTFIDVTKTMLEKKMTPLDMFKLSEKFFVSLGLYPMTPEFWNRSIIEKPKDREIVCHASAWDFYDGKDFRIKQCTRVDMDDLETVHHEMGHIQYYQQYAHQPAVFRGGANPGFHEAIGDVLVLSVSTQSHLQKIDLLPEGLEEDDEMDINILMKMALEKVAFLPFGYMIDAYRWKVFSGEIPPESYNQRWWEMRLKYQGLCPPVRRTEKDFDAAAKYHVIADTPYIRYFVSHIIQFQFHKALCDAAGHEGPLHKCDIYQNKEAGKLLSDMLKLGSSVHWSEAMSVITKGKTKKMDAQPLVEYFDPLIRWLKKQNENQPIGWKSWDPMICPENLNKFIH